VVFTANHLTDTDRKIT